jgi:hypothetical protein
LFLANGDLGRLQLDNEMSEIDYAMDLPPLPEHRINDTALLRRMGDGCRVENLDRPNG